MAEFKKNKTKKNILYSPLVLLFLLFLAIVFIYNMIGLIERTHEAGKKKQLVESHIAELEARKKSLEDDIAKMKTPDGLEETIRDKYQLVRDGEKLVVITDNAAPQAPAPQKSSGGFWEFLKGLFK